MHQSIDFIYYIKLLNNVKPLVFHTIYGNFIINQN